MPKPTSARVVTGRTSSASRRPHGHHPRPTDRRAACCSSWRPMAAGAQQQQQRLADWAVREQGNLAGEAGAEAFRLPSAFPARQISSLYHRKGASRHQSRSISPMPTGSFWGVSVGRTTTIAAAILVPFLPKKVLTSSVVCAEPRSTVGDLLAWRPGHISTQPL
jgi:hypothetical protein